jgi:hypothetical protein
MLIRNRTVRDALEFTALSGSPFYERFPQFPQAVQRKKKEAKKKESGCYYHLPNSPLNPRREYYKGNAGPKAQQGWLLT